MYKVWLCAYDPSSRSASLSRHTGSHGQKEDGLSSQGRSGQEALEKALNWLIEEGERVVSILPLDQKTMSGPYAYIVTEPVVEKELHDTRSVTVIEESYHAGGAGMH